MYGLVNRAIEELVIDRAGPESWEAVKRRAKVGLAGFFSMTPYPDQVTYDLVAAASHVLDTPTDQLLAALGRHWILFTAAEGYGDMLRMAGEDLHEFLQNLDALHSSLGMAMPGLRPPSFVVRDEGDGILRVTYHSQREGLGPMVLGLLEGLAERFNTKVQIERRVKEDCEEFLLTSVFGGH